MRENAERGKMVCDRSKALRDQGGRLGKKVERLCHRKIQRPGFVDPFWRARVKVFVEGSDRML